MSRREQARAIAAALDGALSGVDIYLFGSFTNRRDPSDVDVLLVYDESRSSDEALTRLRQRVVHDVRRITGLPVDVTTLTYDEVRQVDFITSERCLTLHECAQRPLVP